MKGFTIVELLIVIGIFLILALAAVPIYGNLQVSAQLNENTSQIIQVIRLARERSLAGFNNTRHGVKLEPTKYILYQGGSYLSRLSSYDREFELADSLSLLSDFTNNDINFSKSLGEPREIGLVTLTHDVNGTRQIVVNKLGVVEEEN